MTTTIADTTHETSPRGFSRPLDEASVTGTWQGTVTARRATGKAGDRVLIDDSQGRVQFLLTPVEAADLADALASVSGMATSTYAAQFLAQVHRESMARRGVTRSRVTAETGITAHRLRRILSGEVPMTHDEHVVISEVKQTHA